MKFKNHEILKGKDYICTVVAIKHNPTGIKAITIMGKSEDLVYGEQYALKDFYHRVYSFIKQNKNHYGWKNFKYNEFSISIAENTEENYEKAAAWRNNMTLDEYREYKKQEEESELLF